MHLLILTFFVNFLQEELLSIEYSVYLVRIEDRKEDFLKSHCFVANMLARVQTETKLSAHRA